MGEEQPVLPPGVVALVREAREELANQAVLARVDLHTVDIGVDGDPGRSGEPADDGRDVVGLHPLRNLSTVDLGHTRWCPQRRLAVRGRTLAAGVVERSDHERAVRSTRSHDLGPARAASFGEGRSLVRPVRRVDGGTLHDDRSAAPTRPSLVIGHLAGGDRAIVRAEIGDVRAEHDTVRRGSRREGDRRQQLHQGVNSG